MEDGYELIMKFHIDGCVICEFTNIFNFSNKEIIMVLMENIEGSDNKEENDNDSEDDNECGELYMSREQETKEYFIEYGIDDGKCSLDIFSQFANLVASGKSSDEIKFSTLSYCDECLVITEGDKLQKRKFLFKVKVTDLNKHFLYKDLMDIHEQIQTLFVNK